MKKRYLVLAFALFLGLFIYRFSPVLAEDGSGSGKPRPIFNFFNSPKSSESAKPRGPLNPSGSPHPRENASSSGLPRIKGIDRLKDNRLKFCQNHETEINTRLTNLGKLVAEMLGKFDAITQRVEDFYNNKVVPSGKSVANYSTLTADITTKRAAVQTALTNAQSDVSGFSCTSDNPKGQITQFRTDMQTVKTALHDYRTSIKDLIVAVKSVAGEGPRESASPRPTP